MNLPWNPLDWPAGPFLTLEFGVIAAVLAIAIVTRRSLGPADAIGSGPPLQLLQMAYLAGGPNRALDTAMLALLRADAAVLEPGGRTARIIAGAPLEPELAPFSTVGAGGLTLLDFRRANASALQPVRAALVRRGLVPDDAAFAHFRTTVRLLAGLPIVLGTAKLVVGISRDKPVGVLAFMMLFTLIAAINLSALIPFRSRAGTAVLAGLRQEHARAARAPLPAELPLAFALSGVAVLRGSEFEAFFTGPGDGGEATGGHSGGGGGGGCGGCGGGH